MDGTVSTSPTMNLARVSAPIDLLPVPARGREETAQQTSFAEVLGKQHGLGINNRSAEDRARAAAEQLVAVSLVQPLLKQLRDTSKAAPPFAPTQAEKQMQGLQDAILARQIVRAARFPMVDRVAQGMLSRMRGAERAPAKGAP